MEKAFRIKGLIFDMDNTLLQSRINFPALKQEIHEFLVTNKVVSKEFSEREHTSSTLIEHARQSGISDEMYRSIMSIAVKHELTGMEGAGLEPGVRELLEDVHKKYVLVVITNNSVTAAFKALELTEINHYFDLIIGREQMTSLKPSPSGFHYAMDKFEHISSDEWISIGDAWIDGRASTDAGIPFISYTTSIDTMLSKGVRPIAQINRIGDLLSIIEG
jgi:phosphoglycolate phosphatase